MALQTSGAISLTNIQTEFGGSNPISISEYYGVGTVPASGTISLSHFYGQTAFSATWSGSSTTAGIGIGTSGSNFRSEQGAYVGAWLTANSDGTFTNGLSRASYFTSIDIRAGGYANTLSNQLSHDSTYNHTANVISFTIAGGFTGVSLANGGGLETSGGLIRGNNYGAVGAWISLT
jgi:hypothetical protein